MEAESIRGERILVVDDEPAVRNLVCRWLSEEGFECRPAVSAEEAITIFEKDYFPFVISDIMLGGLTGMELFEKVHATRPEVVFLLMTGFGSLPQAITAIKSGAYGYLLKPVNKEDVLFNVLSAIHRRNLETQNRMHREKLELRVLKRSEALRETMLKIEEGHLATIRALGAALEVRDYGTEQHAHRVARFVKEMGQHRGLGVEELDALERGAYLHDLGKMIIPDRILLKPGRLTDEEWQVMQAHSEAGYHMLEGLGMAEEAMALVRHHHERWGGGGYPLGLSERKRPVLARAFALADAFDAMTHRRPYREAMPLDKARDEMARGAGSQFDPDFVETFLEMSEDLLEDLASE